MKHKPIILWLIVLSILGIFSLHKSHTAQVEVSKLKNNQVVGDTTHYGIDVSHHQGEIDWSKVKEWEGNQIKFVYVKATEGSTYIDPMYDTNFEGAKEQGIPVGSYHYFRTSSPAITQFYNFTAQINVKEQNLVPLIDVEEMDEWKGDEFHNNLDKFLKLIEDSIGVKPLLYTVNSFYNKNMSGRYKDYDFLIGRYGPDEPLMKDGKSWAIWQFSESGKVDGIDNPVDIDFVNPGYDLGKLFINK